MPGISDINYKRKVNQRNQRLKKLENSTQFLLGDEAAAYGALYAGCNFFAGYPITPASEIAEVLAKELPRVDGYYVQMEDEIASISAMIGAVWAGGKAMTATSGPGFSLMQENLGYAIMTETPCVLVNVQRSGPSTGQATKPAQGDVLQVRWGTHGDHPIIVLSVSTALECFEITVRAFNLSEKYRVPVIVLADEVVAHTRETVALPEPDSIKIIDRTPPSVPPEWYTPYAENSRGVPPMSAFGEGFRHHVTGLVHDVRGFPTQTPHEVDAFIRRLFRKVTQGFPEIQMTRSFRLEDATVAVIAYGSVARSAQRAVIEARNEGVKAGLLQLRTLFPFPRRIVEPVLKQCDLVVVPEMNMGQISREVKRVNQFGTHVEKYNKVDGRLITPDEIRRKLMGS